MKYISTLVLLLCLSFVSLAQQKDKMSREDKDEKIQARQGRVDLKNDYVIFRRLIVGSREYADERKKIPVLQKTNKMVKVVAVIDSVESDEEAKTLTGSIRQDVGDNSTTMYEITFDRVQKKIVGFRRTQEAMDADKEEQENKAEKAAASGPKEKTVVKKKKTDDDDDDADEEKPAKPTHKGKQTDDDE